MRALAPIAEIARALGLAPIRAAALPCAFLGAVGWWWMYRVGCRFGPAWIAASWTLGVASSDLAIIHVYDVEVWGPLVFWLGACASVLLDPSRRPRLLLEGLVVGLAASHHLTFVFIGPILLGRVIDAARHHDRGFVPSLARAVAGGLLGLSAYATLAWSGEDVGWRWGQTQTFEGWLTHVLRAEYGTLSLSTHDISPELWTLWFRSASNLVHSVFFGLSVPAVLAVALLLMLLATALLPRVGLLVYADQRGIMSGTIASLIATTVLFPGLQNIDPNTLFGAWILERFDIMPACLASWLACHTSQRLWAITGESKGTARHKVFRVSVLAAGVLLLAWRGPNMLTTMRGHVEGRGVESYALDLLRTPAPHTRSLIIGAGDHRTFPILYAQAVLKVAPQVLYVDAYLLTHAWYRERVAQRLGMPAADLADKPLALLAQIWAQPKLQDMPIYATHLFSRPAGRLERFPEGILLRILRPENFAGPDRPALPSKDLQAAITRHQAAWSRYLARPEHFARARAQPRHDPWASALWAAYIEGPKALAQMARSAGDAASARQIEQSWRLWFQGRHESLP